MSRPSTPAPTRIAALAVVLALAACASTHGLAPHVHPTDPDQLAASRSLGAFSRANFPTATWWTTFGDPQLDALIAEALRGTPTLDVADARLRQAIAQAGLADSARKGSVGIGAQYAGLRIPETVGPAPLGGSYQGIVLLTTNIKYDPDFWGAKRSEWKAAIGEAHAAEVEAQAARMLLASNIASTYAVLAQAHEAQDVATAEKARAAHLLELSRQRAKAGLDSQLPVRQAESGVAAAQQQIEAAGQQVDVARNAIAALLGQGPDRALSIAKPVMLSAPLPTVPSILPSELLGHRPDVVAARWHVEAAGHGIEASKAAFYPSVNLSAIVGLASGGLTNLFSGHALLVQGGPAISLPIFDAGARRNKLDKSDADFDLAVSNYNQTLVTALQEVADALQGARALDAQIAAAREASDAASSAWKLAQSRYRAGLATQLDVLAAQQPLLQLDQQLAALRAQRLTAAVDLDRALGGGLTPVAPPSATDLANSR